MKRFASLLVGVAGFVTLSAAEICADASPEKLPISCATVGALTLLVESLRQGGMPEADLRQALAGAQNVESLELYATDALAMALSIPILPDAVQRSKWASTISKSVELGCLTAQLEE